MVSEGRTDGLTASSCLGAWDVSDFSFRNAQIVKALFMGICFTLLLYLVRIGEKVVSSNTSSPEVRVQLLSQLSGP